MSKIARVHGRQILDSRGNPTVEVDVELESGRLRPGSGPVGGIHRPVRGGGAPGRRRRLARQGRDAGRRQRERRARLRALRDGRLRPGGRRQRAHRGGRHAEQGTARRERDSRLLAGHGEGGRGGRGQAALRVDRRSRGARPAGADDERRQRRRPRAELPRPAGVHDRAGRGVDLRRGPADRRRGLPDPEGAPARARASDRGGGRGRFRTGLRARARTPSARSSRRPSGLGTATGSLSRSILLRPRSGATAPTGSRAASRAPTSSSTTGKASAGATPSSRSRTRWPRTSGTAGGR